MPIEEYLSRSGLYETYETLEQDRLARTTTSDDAVDASWLKGGIDVIQYYLVVKLFAGPLTSMILVTCPIALHKQ